MIIQKSQFATLVTSIWIKPKVKYSNERTIRILSRNISISSLTEFFNINDKASLQFLANYMTTLFDWGFGQYINDTQLAAISPERLDPYDQYLDNMMELKNLTMVDIFKIIAIR